MAPLAGTNLPDILYGAVDADPIAGLQSDDLLPRFDGGTGTDEMAGAGFAATGVADDVNLVGG